MTELHKRHGLLMTGAVAVALIAAPLFAWWMVARANREMRDNQLQQTQVVARALNIQQVKALNGTAADLTKPEYQLLTEQIRSICEANTSWRWIYLMGRKHSLPAMASQPATDSTQTSPAPSEGSIFFYLDSEPATSKDHSPPGQVYEEAAAAFHHVFDTGSQTTEGPYTDRWGTWISALVPLIDPQTGAVIAVLGVDIDTHDWKRDVAAQAALPVGLMLMLLIGGIAVLASYRRSNDSPKPILRRLLLPLSAIVVLQTAGAAALLWQQHQQQLTDNIAANVSDIAGDLRVALDQQAAGMALAARPITANSGVQKALRDGDTDHLLATWQPVYKTLHRENHLTHFYFLDTNRVCLLRVHKPEKRGDIINRFTALEAERTGKTASGLDLGPLGTLTLRVVEPVLEKGTLAGYVELGKEIEDVLHTMHTRAGNQIAVVIRKEYLNQQTWEDGMRMLGRSADWNRLTGNALIYSSQDRLPDAFTAWANETSVNHAHGATDREITSDGTVWRVSTMTLQDASGKEVGDLLIMYDISADKTTFMSILYLGGASAVVLLTLLLCFVYVLLHRTDMRVQLQQDRLKESEARIRAIMNSAHDAILMIDNKGNVSYWNTSAERIFGYTYKDAIGCNLHALIVPERFLASHHAAFPAFQQTGQGAAIGKTLELAARRKDGREIDVALSLSAVQINREWHAVGIVQDISDRKRAEAELLATNLHLEKATDMAYNMASQAEAANIAKSEFLANMSHEIRTPMNGIIGMTGLLLDSGLSDEQRRYADIVRTSGESLLGLINDILDFSKIEAHRLDLETLDFDLSGLLDDFAAAMAVRAHEKGLELLCAADPSVPTLLRGDPSRLRQILTNLTGNAIKFTQSGEVSVRVVVEERSQEEEKRGPRSEVSPHPSSSILLRFTIKDTGIGIPADKIGLLFNKFSQIDASTTRQYGGTGLGLAISKQLVELMGGSVGVNSVAGKGSQFWFTVRLDTQTGKAQAGSLSTTELSGVRVLIVDDNATSREILTTRLTSWGMRASEAQDAAVALHSLQVALSENDPFPIAIIDMQMPGMDGETLGRTIKADKKLADTQMVMLTSLGMRGDAKRFETIGFAAYATKPIRHQDLKALLSLALAKQNNNMDSVPSPITAPHKSSGLLNMFAGSNARILVAEDNTTNQMVAITILTKLGLRADAVADGAEAIKTLETIPYDLVLMDVQMPEMDGFEATRRIRQGESARAEGGRLKPEVAGDTAANSLSFSGSETQVSGFIPHHPLHLPIIAMTANAMQGDRQQCLDAGMDDYVSKPVSPQELADVLKKWLNTNTNTNTNIEHSTLNVQR